MVTYCSHYLYIFSFDHEAEFIHERLRENEKKLAFLLKLQLHVSLHKTYPLNKTCQSLVTMLNTSITSNLK